MLEDRPCAAGEMRVAVEAVTVIRRRAGLAMDFLLASNPDRFRTHGFARARDFGRVDALGARAKPGRSWWRGILATPQL